MQFYSLFNLMDVFFALLSSYHINPPDNHLQLSLFTRIHQNKIAVLRIWVTQNRKEGTVYPHLMECSIFCTVNSRQLVLQNK